MTTILAVNHLLFNLFASVTNSLFALRLQGNEDIRSVVMINCGAICNVVDLLSQLSPEAYVYIVDSNRPVHLANVYPKKDRCRKKLFFHPVSLFSIPDLDPSHITQQSSPLLHFSKV